MISIQDKKNLYFVFEHCPKGTLANLIKIKEIISEDLAKIYTTQLISTLEYIHSNNIKHRDLKPENILLTEDYQLKIVRQINE